MVTPAQSVGQLRSTYIFIPNIGHKKYARRRRLLDVLARSSELSASTPLLRETYHLLCEILIQSCLLPFVLLLRGFLFRLSTRSPLAFYLDYHTLAHPLLSVPVLSGPRHASLVPPTPALTVHLPSRRVRRTSPQLP